MRSNEDSGSPTQPIDQTDPCHVCAFAAAKSRPVVLPNRLPHGSKHRVARRSGPNIIRFRAACAPCNMSVEVVPAQEDFLGDGAPRVGAPEAASLGGELLPVDGELVALEVGLEVKGARTDGTGVATDVFAVDVCAGDESVTLGQKLDGIDLRLL